MKITCRFLPSQLEATDKVPSVGNDRQAAVVIDILRATTTMTTALAFGAKQVIPCLEIEDAFARRLDEPGVILGGERGGVPIEGFDFGNSPTDYTPETVGRKTVVFTSTNGTRALHAIATLNTIILGAFINLSAVVRQLSNCDQVLLLCAGTNGAVTREDVLFAGAVTSRLAELNPSTSLNDEASMARDTWRSLESIEGDTAVNLQVELAATLGGRNLIKLGYQGDFLPVSEIDAVDIVPAWNPTTGVIQVP